MIDLSVLMEPRGFIKVFQFMFVICAFACTCDFRGDVVLTATCPNAVVTVTSATTYFTDPPTSNDTTASSADQVLEGNGTVFPSQSGTPMLEEERSTSSPGWSPSASAKEDFVLRDDALATTLEPAGPLPLTVQFKTTFKYAFKLDQLTVKGKNCNDTEVIMKLGSSYAAPSSFYVFVGVSAMLYTLMATVLYTAFKQYYEMEWVPVVDLAIHFAYTIMWFAGSIAWAVAVTSIKEEAKITTIIDNNPFICYENVDCTMDQITWQLLDFSIVFGFLNFVLYLVNMWFIFKETTFYSKKTHPTIS